jgi:F-type H+-transporting ATPase subunit delta
MKDTRLAKRYARALLELALEKGNETKVREDMHLVSDVCESNRDFRRLLLKPGINSDKKQSIIKEIFGKIIQELSMSFLLLIASKRREVFIDEIAKNYIGIYMENKGIKTATIETVVKIDDDTKEAIIKLLAERTKNKIEVVEVINVNLVGGFKLTFDNKQYDTSIQNEIRKLRKEFQVNIYEKGF